jgi:hypothetical protein
MTIQLWRQQYNLLQSTRKVPDLKQFEFSRHIFFKVPSANFRGNPSSGSRDDACGQTYRRMDGHDERYCM